MLTSAFGPLAVSSAVPLPFGGSTAAVSLKPVPDVAVIVKLVVPSSAVALDRAETAAGSAALAELAVSVGAGALAAGVAPLLSQPASANAAVASVARPSPASRGVRMSVLPDVPDVPLTPD